MLLPSSGVDEKTQTQKGFRRLSGPFFAPWYHSERTKLRFPARQTHSGNPTQLPPRREIRHAEARTEGSFT
jgi:hypothetical protein